jgi:hypothetical protein
MCRLNAKKLPPPGAEFAHADMTTLSKVDTNCTALFSDANNNW